MYPYWVLFCTLKGFTMLATLLGSETRARILKLLLGRDDPPFHVRELVREAAIGSSGVQRELTRLAGSG